MLWSELNITRLFIQEYGVRHKYIISQIFFKIHINDPATLKESPWINQEIQTTGKIYFLL